MQTNYKSKNQKQRNPHLPASASAALKYAINASSAFSCTGAFESATVFLKKCPDKFKKKNKEINHASRSKRECTLANNNSAENRIQIHHREIEKRIRKLKNPIWREKKTLTEFADARVFRIGDGVAERRQIDVRLVAHLPILVEEAILPRQFLRLLQQLLFLRHCCFSPIKLQYARLKPIDLRRIL